MDNCIFCKIISGEIPNYTVYEDDHTLAFLDISPCAKGHTVVIPKVHAETLLDLPTVEIPHLFNTVQKAMQKIQEVLVPEGFNVGWNHGRAGGQAVPHLHIHILPRWHSDGGKNMHAIIENAGDKSVEEVATLFS